MFKQMVSWAIGASVSHLNQATNSLSHLESALRFAPPTNLLFKANRTPKAQNALDSDIYPDHEGSSF